jgi:hypothetical protein
MADDGRWESADGGVDLNWTHAVAGEPVEEDAQALCSEALRESVPQLAVLDGTDSTRAGYIG